MDVRMWTIVFFLKLLLLEIRLPLVTSQVTEDIEDIILSGGEGPYEGTVMVKTPISSEYLPLCDDRFGMTEANLVCRFLGYQRALRFTRHNHFNFPATRPWTPDAWKSMYELGCLESNSSSPTLEENCLLYENRLYGCIHSEVAGVVCQTDESQSNCSYSEYVCEDEYTTCLNESIVCDGNPDCTDGSDEDTRLCNKEEVFRLEKNVDSASLPQNSVAGTIYMKYGTIWRTICDRDFEINEAKVICRGLGYPDGMSVPFMLSYFGQSFLLSLRIPNPCLGSETSLFQCPGFEWEAKHCLPSGDSGVLCIAGNLHVQLAGGRTHDSGRLEIWSDKLSSPATICDTGFDDLDAQVVCRMLGYQDVSRAIAHRGSPYGGGSGVVWNIILECYGDEETIQDCRMKISNDTCTPLNTAAVTCRPEKNVDELLSAVLPRDCGNAEESADKFLTSLGKIRGGFVPSRFDVPWLAALYARARGEYRYQCAAVIISEYYLLSAAHCLQLPGRLGFRVDVGNFNSNYKDAFEQSFLIDKLWIHEHFQELGFFDNDIALIKIEANHGRGIRFSERVKPVCLPRLGESYKNLTACSVSGWGSFDDIPRSSIVPRKARTDVTNDNFCERFYGSRKYYSSGACFFGRNQNNPCKGDSGAPVTCRGPNMNEVLYSIVSHGAPCDPDNHIFDINVRVTKFLRWLQEKMYQDSFLL